MNTPSTDKLKKLDLHIHTPKSACYGDKSVSPEAIVDAAVSAGLDAIAITDHNSFEAIEQIRKAAEKTNLIIFPGVELSLNEGHFIALFEVDQPVNQLEYFLQELQIPIEGRGNGTYLVDLGFEVVFEKIHQKGGIVIAAHIERWPSGFLESNADRSQKMKIHGSEYLNALEITISQNKDMWNKGQAKGYPKKHACIQSSDAHAPDEIGRRSVHVRMEQLTLEGLKAAFADFETCIVFPEDRKGARI